MGKGVGLEVGVGVKVGVAVGKGMGIGADVGVGARVEVGAGVNEGAGWRVGGVGTGLEVGMGFGVVVGCGLNEARSGGGSEGVLAGISGLGVATTPTFLADGVGIAVGVSCRTRKVDWVGVEIAVGWADGPQPMSHQDQEASSHRHRSERR